MNITHRNFEPDDQTLIEVVFLKPHGKEIDILIDGERCRVTGTPEDLVAQLRECGGELLHATITKGKFGAPVEAGEKIVLDLGQLYACGAETQPAQTSQETWVHTGFYQRRGTGLYIDTPYRTFSQKMGFPFPEV